LSTEPSVKLTFKLSEEERGPYPVATESLWCTPEGPLYRINNIPFFLENLSFGDLVSVKAADGEAGTFEIDSVVEASGHSTLWVMVSDKSVGTQVLDALVALGCGREGGVFEGVFALNVPPTVDLQEVLDALKPAIASGAVIADYPSIRH
jgi:Domain of unknown function (DUF4265)